MVAHEPEESSPREVLLQQLTNNAHANNSKSRICLKWNYMLKPTAFDSYNYNRFSMNESVGVVKKACTPCLVLIE
jgi:hypothetical protein